MPACVRMWVRVRYVVHRGGGGGTQQQHCCQVAENDSKGASKKIFWSTNFDDHMAPILAISGRKGTEKNFLSLVFRGSLDRKYSFGVVNLVLF